LTHPTKTWTLAARIPSLLNIATITDHIAPVRRLYSTATISVDDYSPKSETMVVKRRAWSTEYVDDGTLPPFGEYELEETVPIHKGEEFIECDESEKKRYFWHRRKSSEDSSFPSWPPGNPQAAGDYFRSTLIFTAKKRKSTFSFAVMAFCMFGFSLYSSARSTLRMALTEASDLVAFSERLNLQMSTAERDVRLLERELAALDAMEQQKEDMEEEKKILHQAAEFANPQVVQEMNTIQRKLRYSANRAEKLKEQVKDISRRDAISKYGAGVKQVEIELIFPGNLEGPTTFVIEMAPIDIMPHSVFTFLEMVSSGLLNGCSFILNALHVLKVAPLPYDGTSASDKARDFLENGLESVAFREYSHEYPHKRFTVGFAADGSPSFYINTEDNTEIHVGDPCFAKIVSGFDTIKRLEASPTRNGIWFEHRIGIKRATVL
jgi:cyclophilin family peptidyl-prolyl cis-trans isomerase